MNLQPVFLISPTILAVVFSGISPNKNRVILYFFLTNIAEVLGGHNER